MITTELIINSFKHAFKGHVHGAIKIKLNRSHDGEFIYVFSDNGPGLLEDYDIANRKKLGFRLIQVLAEEMGSEMNYPKHKGFKASLTFSDKE